MYGGGFATIPAYLADMFGTQYVGRDPRPAAHRLVGGRDPGPVLVNYIREYQIDRGIPAAQAYNVTMYVMAGLLVAGFFANLAVRPVDDRYYMSDDELARERGLAAVGSRHDRLHKVPRP